MVRPDRGSARAHRAFAIGLALSFALTGAVQACEECVAKERVLFASLGRADSKRIVLWTPREALEKADEELRALAGLRIAGRPNPRAEARVAELKSIIQGRAEGNGVLAARAKARGPMVWIGRFLGRRSSEFHALNCRLLRGILTEVSLTEGGPGQHDRLRTVPAERSPGARR